MREWEYWKLEVNQDDDFMRHFSWLHHDWNHKTRKVIAADFKEASMQLCEIFLHTVGVVGRRIGIIGFDWTLS